MVKRLVFGFAVVCAAILFVPTSANAAPATVNGPCDGSGKLEKLGKTVEAAESGVVEVEYKDTVDWEGSITGTSGEQPYSGNIEVELPAPFGSLSIDSWKGKTDSTSNSGTKDYDIPSWVPANVEFRVKGIHTQGSATCAGAVKLKLKGSSLNAFSIGSLIGTALTGLGLALAGRAKGGS